ncbi:ABC transporter ATP-binding protein [Corynebacterium glucuronolyticum]|uniref:ABC transporter ATP-binding protein n=1 Tax=Corynebacterium glucuronolyticum TaxID=39791 RepID=UPI00019C1D9E|nr:ABC transporter ATP-binding protein [Corynebacterium glucuronolyticum]EEI28056.1 ABC transporter, ATP-binding protein [Corynebacterium glucuronolyticum ATCC 51867]QRO81906.1 ABC transporter ATP-binding protein [Corynebacterium glucuronolyticum]
MTTPILAAEQITKAFNSATVLRGIDLHVAPGEKVAIMGPSGSGKSTFLNCLAGILTPTSGTVTFQGKVISSASDAQRSALRLRDFGFIFQDSMLIPELPARENVALPLRLTGVKTSDALDRADALLHHVGLGEHSHKLPAELSGGQAQRVAIARGLVHQPSVVFADEPTGALDQASGHQAMQLITLTLSHYGGALVLVTHDTKVARWCDRLVEIRDGLIHSDQTLRCHEEEN